MIDSEGLGRVGVAGVGIVLNEVGAAGCDDLDPHFLGGLAGSVDIEHFRIHTDIEAAVAVVARVGIRDEGYRGEAGVVGLAEIVTDEELEVEVWNAVAVVVDHVDDELRPACATDRAGDAFRVHFDERGLAEVESGGLPGVVVVCVGEMEEADDEVADIGVGSGDDRAVILAVDGDHGSGDAPFGPGADGAPSGFACGVDEPW